MLAPSKPMPPLPPVLRRTTHLQRQAQPVLDGVAVSCTAAARLQRRPEALHMLRTQRRLRRQHRGTTE